MIAHAWGDLLRAICGFSDRGIPSLRLRVAHLIE
jgi:hypothetical protein